MENLGEIVKHSRESHSSVILSSPKNIFALLVIF